MPEGAPWADEFLREVCAFPAGQHDDYVDALFYAIIHLRSSLPSFQNWKQWVRDTAIRDIALRESRKVAASRLGMELREVEEIITDCEAEDDLYEFYLRGLDQLDLDRRCYHCGGVIIRGTTVTDNGIQRFHKECAMKRQREGLPI